jgi:hypothetical protein
MATIMLKRASGLFEPWGQYVRTDKYGKMKGDTEADRRARKADEQKEEIQSGSQAHIAPRGNTLLGVSE